MDSYKKIATRYMKKSIGRTIFTILGVAGLALIIYIIVSTFLASNEASYKMARKEADYEMCFYVDNEEQLKGIVGEGFIKSATIGKDYNYQTDEVKEDALCININNPYTIDKKFNYIVNKYGVTGRINDDVACYYLQGNDKDDAILSYLIISFFSFLIAIGGIGIIRNSMFLFLSEYLKDFGMLRCVGGTKKQIRKIFTRICGMIEIYGILIGFLLGIPVSIVLSGIFVGKVKIYILPVIIASCSFLFDLFFLVRDITKKLNKLSPIMAVHGNMNSIIKHGKIKARGGGLLFRVFGTEGIYAYKNIMRKPGRFVLNIFVFSFGISVIVIFGSVITSISKSQNEKFDMAGEYQMIINSPQYISTEPMVTMPAEDVLKSMSKKPYVKEVKKENSIVTYVSSDDFITGKLTDQYKKIAFDSATGAGLYADKPDKIHMNYMTLVKGYDEDDMKMLEKYLVEGSLDVKEGEIILVNYEPFRLEDYSMLGFKSTVMKKFTYKVGDTIDLLDYKKMREEYGRLKPLEDSDGNWIKSVLDERIGDIHKSMVKKGEYKSYKIKGIVKIPEAKDCFFRMNLIMPIEHYREYSGLGEDEFTGFKFKFIKEKIETDMMRNIDEYSDYIPSVLVDYIEGAIYNGVLKIFFGILTCVFFIMLCNYINNVSANINMRRKEFAQLRVIGITKSGIRKIVLIEGIVTIIFASFIGYFVGNAIAKGIFDLFVNVLTITYKTPVGFFVAAVIGLTLTVYLTETIILKHMKINMAEDLREEGY